MVPGCHNPSLPKNGLMRAMRIHGYGGPEVFVEELVAIPAPQPEDILVRVYAASVNPIDWKIRSGGQRNIIPLRLPWILGMDVSGVVVAKGARVTRFQVGDEVWASPSHLRPGSYAEYMCIAEKQAARKPKNLTHDEAASMPLVGLTAYQCLVTHGHLRAGQTLLVHAGAGGVGAFAIQLGKHLGAHVVTTCSAGNTAFVTSLGADSAIDYNKAPFSTSLSNVDLMLDSLGEDAFVENLKVMKRGGRIANIAVDVPRHVARYGAFLSLFALSWTMTRLHLAPFIHSRIVFRHIVKRARCEDLERITELVETCAIRPTVARIFPLSEIEAAHRLSQTQRTQGKLVIHVADAELGR
jgi:NADPH:quinone reductase-like Zn-dependent oxidoreductase